MCAVFYLVPMLIRWCLVPGIRCCAHFGAHFRWLTHWGEGGANSSSSAPHTDAILKLNGSISLYMGHGGTNWGFWSGANGGGGSSFQPHETSVSAA